MLKPCFFLVLSLLAFAFSQDGQHERYVDVRDGQIFVEGKPFYIQGICYSPVPVGESVNWPPYGDYFTLDYAYIWQRDLPLIKAMGATTIRIYGWRNELDHTAFLDAVHDAGLKVLVTYFLGDAKLSPVRTQEDRNKIIQNFVAQVARYAEHPAILMWSFGNELNGSWNLFTEQLSDAFGCWWNAYCVNYQDTNSDCQWQSSCMYYQLFSFINAAAKAAKIVTTRPIISGLADVDYLIGNNGYLDKVARFEYLLPDIDAWAVQLYRGRSFGGYFWMYRWESKKALIVTEYGSDAYNDPCGWPENQSTGGCFNLPGDGVGGDVAPPGRPFIGCNYNPDLDCHIPGVQSQTDWDMRLSSELMQNHPNKGGVVWGGFLMAWSDEYWKGVGTQDFCWHPCRWEDREWCRTAGVDTYKPGGSAGCTWKAHYTCSNWNTGVQDLCGYWLAAASDHYVNEQWFGITVPAPCGRTDQDGGHRLDTLYLRPAFLGMQQLWTGLAEVDTSFTTCAALTPCWECSTTHTPEQLKKGICKEICKIHVAAVGPGSSNLQTKLREEEEHKRSFVVRRLLEWFKIEPESFFGRFFVPILLGLAMLTACCCLTMCLLLRKGRDGTDEERRPLIAGR